MACLELHTYSSLDATFIEQFKDTLIPGDEAIVFYDPVALKIKNRAPIDPDTIKKAFDHPSIQVITAPLSLEEELMSKQYSNCVLVMMSSGNFDGMDFDDFSSELFS